MNRESKSSCFFFCDSDTDRPQNDEFYIVLEPIECIHPVLNYFLKED